MANLSVYLTFYALHAFYDVLCFACSSAQRLVNSFVHVAYMAPNDTVYIN